MGAVSSSKRRFQKRVDVEVLVLEELISIRSKIGWESHGFDFTHKKLHVRC